MRRCVNASLAGLAIAFTVQSVLAITIPTVPIGDVGNVNDPTTGNLYGGVSRAYSIGKYEVTVAEYTEFLNAVAATDTYKLYSPNMGRDLNIAGVAQSGAPGNYNYTVICSPKHPITNIGWGDAARFANWLHNGQPTGAEGPGTTETGAYTLNGFMLSNDLMTVTRNANAKWFIPTESEWYKAAYYQPAAQGGDSDGYWAYPMKTNSRPYSDQTPGATPDNTRVGNFYQDDGLANGFDNGFAVTGSTSSSASQNYLTDVGAYSSSSTYYNTFDQGGNVWEWNEAAVTSLSRGVRGGSWYFPFMNDLHASNRNSLAPAYEDFNIGFRVASIPEPDSIALWLAAVLLLLASRGWHPRVS